jgi:hypothetical protein
MSIDTMTIMCIESKNKGSVPCSWIGTVLYCTAWSMIASSTHIMGLHWLVLCYVMWPASLDFAHDHEWTSGQEPWVSLRQLLDSVARQHRSDNDPIRSCFALRQATGNCCFVMVCGCGGARHWMDGCRHRPQAIFIWLHDVAMNSGKMQSKHCIFNYSYGSSHSRSLVFGHDAPFLWFSSCGRNINQDQSQVLFQLQTQESSKQTLAIYTE